MIFLFTSKPITIPSITWSDFRYLYYILNILIDEIKYSELINNNTPIKIQSCEEICNMHVEKKHEVERFTNLFTKKVTLTIFRSFLFFFNFLIKKKKKNPIGVGMRMLRDIWTWRSWRGAVWSKPPMFTESRLVQCPHLTVTMLSKLLPGTLTWIIRVRKCKQ